MTDHVPLHAREASHGHVSLAAQVAHALNNDVPGHWAQPAAIALPSDVMAILSGVAAAWERGEHTIVPRLFSGGEPLGFHPERHLPGPGDHSLADFLRRLRRERSGPDTGMLLEDAPTFCPALYLRIQAFLSALYDQIGMPPGGAHSEMFLGDYASSFFSIHKDSLHTVTTVLEGRKRFLLWPSETFHTVPALADTRHVQATLPPELDTPALRAQAHIIEGGPGDVLFWPASWWHVAEQVPGTTFAITLTVALSPVVSRAPGACFRMVSRALEDLFDDGWSPRPPPLPRSTNVCHDTRQALVRMQRTVDRLTQQDVVRAAYQERVLAWLSANGFERVPDPRPGIPFSPEDTVITDGIRRIWWSTENRTDDTPDDTPVTFAANGLVLEATAAYCPLTRFLNTAAQTTVADLIQRFQSPHLSADDICGALSALYAVRAIEQGPG